MVTRLRLGDIEVYSFVENQMQLDGGAMFGVIPKKLWTREIPADANNLIPLNLNLLLIKAHGKTLLVDTGCGDVGTDREKKIYGLTQPTRIDAGLMACGVTPEELDFVLLSHLHFDHSSGGLKRDKSGQPVTRFPNARYVVNNLEWDDARWPNERTRATYVPDYVAAYEKSGQVETVEGVSEFMPGIHLQLTGGHTAGHQAIVIRGGGKALGYFADIFPTHVHLKTAWVPAVDTFPLESLRVKKEILKSCVCESIWLAFDHDLELRLARVEQVDNAYVARALPEDLLEVVEA
jgi:glyoxylase-like metal-dependent hydrolase (beta-lactamase superfamily II)